MRLLKAKTYPVWELGVLKLCVLSFGMVLGAYMAPWVLRHLWLFALVFAMTYVRAIYFYWFTRDV